MSRHRFRIAIGRAAERFDVTAPALAIEPVREVTGVVGHLFARIASAVGQTMSRWGLRGAAQHVLQIAFRRDPGCRRAALELAALLSKGDVDGVSVDSLLGLVDAPVADVSAARRVLEQCLRRHPGDGSLLRRLGRINLDAGDADRARALFKESVTNVADAETSYLLARTAALEAELSGGFSNRTFQLHHQHTGDALRLDGGHQGARYHRLRVAIRAEDWAVAAAALTPVPHDELTELITTLLRSSSPDDVAEVEQELAVARSTTGHVDLPPDWLFATHWRLLHLGRYHAAFDAKALIAEATIALDETRSLAGLVSTVQSRVFLGQFDAAERLLDRVDTERRPEREHSVIRSLIDDVALFSGRSVARSSARPRSPAPLAASEQNFRESVAGKRVAVIGPAPIDIDVDDLSAFDVIIRPKLLVDHGRSDVTQIGYYANTTATLLASDIDDFHERGGIDLAVFRPTAWTSASSGTRRTPWKRFVQRESLAWFQASPYALQRILFDLVTSPPHDVPAEIKVFKADLFAGPVAYDTIYRHDRDHRYSPAGLRPNLDGYGHDLLTDFHFTKALVDNGVVDASTELTRVVSMTSHEYLSALETAGESRIVS